MDELSATGLITTDSRIDRAIVGALRGQDLSGFEIWHWLGSAEGVAGLITEADLYPTLYRLEAERVIAGAWHEGERTRRRYRLTAKTLGQSEGHGRHPTAFQGTAGDSREPGASRTRIEPEPTHRTHSPDPDSGAWFVPPKPEPATSQPTSAPPSGGYGSPAGTTVASGRAADAPTPDDLPLPGGAAIARYADDVIATVDLPPALRSEVRHEIADHLFDAADALTHGGMDAEAATMEAIERLGPAQALAGKIATAQHSVDRRNRALRRAIFEFVGETALWLALSGITITVAPGIGDRLIALGRVFGVHLTYLRSAEWATTQLAFTLCVGAFVAGRMSLGHLARISRHSDAEFRTRWSLGGAAVQLAFVLALPCHPDPLVVATFLAVPLAFIAGTFRPTHVGEDLYSIRALVVAGFIMVAVVFLPAVRLFAYDPNGTPGTPFGTGDSFSYLVIEEHTDGTFDYSTPAASGDSVSFELWPASTDGFYVVVDRSATAPALVVTKAVDLATLPPSGQWWVVAVEKSAAGKRTAVAVAIQSGASSPQGTVLGWLISHL